MLSKTTRLLLEWAALKRRHVMDNQTTWTPVDATTSAILKTLPPCTCRPGSDQDCDACHRRTQVMHAVGRTIRSGKQIGTITALSVGGGKIYATVTFPHGRCIAPLTDWL